MTTPTNQEDIEPQIKRLVTNVYIDAVEAAQGMPLYRTRTLGSVTDPVGEATQAINTIIANKCNEARIDELEKLTDEQMNSQDWERANPGYSVEMVEATKIYDRLAELTKGGNNE